MNEPYREDFKGIKNPESNFDDGKEIDRGIGWVEMGFHLSEKIIPDALNCRIDVDGSEYGMQYETVEEWFGVGYAGFDDTFDGKFKVVEVIDGDPNKTRNVARGKFESIIRWVEKDQIVVDEVSVEMERSEYDKIGQECYHI